MRILIPGALLSYTGASQVEARGATLGALFDDLDQHFPGIRFRVVDEQGKIRPHMRVFINGAQAMELSHPLSENDEIALVQALSGG